MSDVNNNDIKVRGNNVTHHNCILCGSKLTKDEFYSCFDMCKPCKRKHFDKHGGDYRDKHGENKIDEILVSKFSGRKGN